jgi:hypothetical protein
MSLLYLAIAIVVVLVVLLMIGFRDVVRYRRIRKM